MNQLPNFQEFLTGQSVQVPVVGFVANLLLTAALALILGWLYVHCGSALSNRKHFAGNFILLATTTMLIISVVKSSLALSLGLVGALSIVRFRAAIKEPEELAYLFLTIAIGLGLGADQRTITLVAFVMIAAIIWIKSYFRQSMDSHNLYLTVSSNNPKKTDLEDIVRILKDHCSEVNLKRFDETPDALEASFLVGFDDFSRLNNGKAELQTLGDFVTISFLDSEGIAA